MSKQVMVGAIMMIALSGTGGRAAAQERLRPDWVVERASESSPTLAAATARIRAARARVAQAGRIDDPMLMLRVWEIPLDVVSAPPAQLMFMAQQSIPLGGVSGDRERVEATRVIDAETESEIAHHAVVEEAELAFVAYWEAWRRAEAWRALRDLTLRLRDATTAQIGGGAITAADVSAAEMELVRAEVELEGATLRAEGAGARLRVLLGIGDGDSLPPPADLAVAAGEPELAALIAEALRMRPERRLALAGAARARALADAAGAESAPVLTVGGGVMVMPHEEQITHQIGWMVELGINLPLWNDAREGRSREASAAAAEAREAGAAWRRAIATDVTAAWEEARIARARLAAIETRLLPVARASYDASVAQIGAGRGPGATTGAMRTLAALELERVAALGAAVRGEVMLSHAVGRLPHRFALASDGAGGSR